METTWTGMIIMESLKNPDILSGFKVVDIRTDDDWHIYTVQVDRAGLETVRDNLVDNYYAHFKSGRAGAVVFKDRAFEMSVADKSTWAPAIEYGISIGVPAEQMDFEFDELEK